MKMQTGLERFRAEIAGMRLTVFEGISLMEFDSWHNQDLIGLRPEGENFDNASQTIAGSETEDPLSFGRTIEEGNIMVHHNCLYLSSNLIQRGNSRVGILHFLMDDIVAEARRCRHLICVYCQRPSASIGCCKSGCRRTFHTKCGIKNLAQNQFRGTYKSYCHRHVITHRRRPTSSDTICVICTELLVEEGERFNVVNMLYSPCCRNGWYHRGCLHVYANTSGYFFKCPLCNNNEEFHDVTLWGFALSSQDATWETEPNAYAEHFRRDMVCVAEKCIALAGRTDNSILLLYCNTCGSNPAHALCIGQVVSPVPPSLVDSEIESVNSDDSDTFEWFAQAASNHTPPRNQSPTTLTNGRDYVQPKLYSSGWDLNDGNDTEDDEEVFQREAEMQERQQTIAELSEDSSDEQPSTSAAAAQLLVIRRSTRSTAASDCGPKTTKRTPSQPAHHLTPAGVLCAAVAQSQPECLIQTMNLIPMPKRTGANRRSAPHRPPHLLCEQTGAHALHHAGCVQRALLRRPPHHSGGSPQSLQRPIATREKHAPQDHGRLESDSLA
ncbi:uncharacterized protein LOC119560281 [Drosophila subpulchrella]|uniref:uncharacterized protein LOC119560281 n=1 Tax=Drosophila subpulchrella TaxID=1486046 RepID=UPI0018A1579A|nr:uncharacterized protein LOC119560281 [Drosophila subpulchrella]